MTDPTSSFSHLAFAGDEIIARGALPDVALKVRRALQSGEHRNVIVLESATSQVVDLDLRGSDHDIVQRLGPAADCTTTESSNRTPGPGRPHLGVVSREVSLLPRHWDWLKSQRGGASAALRRLVDEARKQGRGRDEASRLQEAIDRYLRVMAGDRPNYEEVSRAFYAHRDADLRDLVAAWPADVRSHLEVLLQRYSEARSA
jgi:uncharacterized protein